MFNIIYYGCIYLIHVFLQIPIYSMETAEEKKRRLARERQRRRRSNMSQEDIEARREADGNRLLSYSAIVQKARRE